MSSRQMRRLQHLVDASADAELECVSEFPNTMKPQGKKKKSKKDSGKNEIVERTDKEAVSSEQAQGEPLAAGSAEKIPAKLEANTEKVQKQPISSNETENIVANEKSKSKNKEKVKDNTNEEKKKKGSQKAENKSGKRKNMTSTKKSKIEEEEDALLEQALRANGVCEVSSDEDNSLDLLKVLLLCDADNLNMRNERIKTFGASAVEDYGDGKTPHRRPDGQPISNGENSLFGEHHAHIRYRPSALGTPNHYRWPPYDSLGVCFSPSSTPDGWQAIYGFTGQADEREPLFLELDGSSRAYQKSIAACNAVTENFRDINQLIECFARYGVYSVPPLLVAISALEAVGQKNYAQELTDVALYHVGCLLSKVALSATWRRRILWNAAPALETLRKGIEVALQRGCTRTAFEMSKLLLSFDPTDPSGALVFLFYAALRAKQWIWIIVLYEGYLKASEAKDEKDGGADNSAEGSWSNRSTALYLKDLPSFFFSVALARFFLEREEESSSRILKNLSATEQLCLDSTPSSSDLLCSAILRFPVAASLLLAEVLKSSEASPQDPCWREIESVADRIIENISTDATSATKDPNDYAKTAATLFVEVHNDIWKPQEVQKMLKSVVNGALSEYRKRTGEEICAEVNLSKETLLRVYLNSRDFSKSTATAVPLELLREIQAQDEEEDDLDFVNQDPGLQQRILNVLRNAGFDRRQGQNDDEEILSEDEEGEDVDWYSVDSYESDDAASQESGSNNRD